MNTDSPRKKWRTPLAPPAMTWRATSDKEHVTKRVEGRAAPPQQSLANPRDGRRRRMQDRLQPMRALTPSPPHRAVLPKCEITHLECRLRPQFSPAVESPKIGACHWIRFRLRWCWQLRWPWRPRGVSDSVPVHETCERRSGQLGEYSLRRPELPGSMS